MFEYIVEDIELNRLSAHTTLDGIFEMVKESVVENVVDENDEKAWLVEFEKYSDDDKKNFLEENGYKLHEPTGELISQYTKQWNKES